MFSLSSRDDKLPSHSNSTLAFLSLSPLVKNIDRRRPAPQRFPGSVFLMIQEKSMRRARATRPLRHFPSSSSPPRARRQELIYNLAFRGFCSPPSASAERDAFQLLSPNLSLGFHLKGSFCPDFRIKVLLLLSDNLVICMQD